MAFNVIVKKRFWRLSLTLGLLSLETFAFSIHSHAQENGSKSNIFVAARLGDIQSIAKQLENGLPIDTLTDKGYSMLFLAIYNKQTELAKFLIDKGADCHTKDFMQNTLLMGAAFKGERELVSVLIEKGADVNERNGIGATALMFAALKGHKEIVLLLIQHGADLNAIDQRGFTALALAIHQGASEVIELIEKLSDSEMKKK